MKQRGFTLLEVMVATLIMAIAVTGLLSAISTSMRNAARLTDYDRAVILGRQKMDEFILASNTQVSPPLEGVWPPEITGGTPTGYRANISQFEAPPGAKVGTSILERVQLEVWWGEKHKTFVLEGYRQTVMRPLQ